MHAYTIVQFLYRVDISVRTHIFPLRYIAFWQYVTMDASVTCNKEKIIVSKVIIIENNCEKTPEYARVRAFGILKRQSRVRVLGYELICAIKNVSLNSLLVDSNVKLPNLRSFGAPLIEVLWIIL